MGQGLLSFAVQMIPPLLLYYPLMWLALRGQFQPKNPGAFHTFAILGAWALAFLELGFGILLFGGSFLKSPMSTGLVMPVVAALGAVLIAKSIAPKKEETQVPLEGEIATMKGGGPRKSSTPEQPNTKMITGILLISGVGILLAIVAANPRLKKSILSGFSETVPVSFEACVIEKMKGLPKEVISAVRIECGRITGKEFLSSSELRGQDYEWIELDGARILLRDGYQFINKSGLRSGLVADNRVHEVSSLGVEVARTTCTEKSYGDAVRTEALAKFPAGSDVSDAVPELSWARCFWIKNVYVRYKL